MSRHARERVWQHGAAHPCHLHGHPRLGVLGQLAGRYLLLETDGGYVTVDPRAAHERVLYERLMERRVQGEAFSPPAIPADDEGEVEVQLTRSGKRLRVPRARSLLEGLEAAGLRPKHGCRMGICNTCVCTRQSGATRHLHDGRRETEPDAAVRLCVSAPSTDLSLDL